MTMFEVKRSGSLGGKDYCVHDLDGVMASSSFSLPGISGCVKLKLHSHLSPHQFEFKQL